jgi:vancomycin resistance protein YoaR
VPRSLRIVLLVLLVPVALALLVGIVFAVDRVTNGGEVLGSVEAGTISLGGIGEDDARAEIIAFEDRLRSTPIEARVEGQTFVLDPAAVGFEIDEEAIVAQALRVGREGNLVDQFTWWIGRFGDDPEMVPIPYTFDGAALEAVVAEWEIEGIADPPTEGSVEVVDREIVFAYPRPGTGIDRAEAVRLLGEALGREDRTPIELSAVELAPAMTIADVDAVVAEAESLISGPVTLINDEYDAEIIVPPEILATALFIGRDEFTSPATFPITFLGEPLRRYIEPRTDSMGTEPVDAEIVIEEDDTVTLVPSTPAFEPDATTFARAVAAAARSPERNATLVFGPGTEADFSTADAEALGIEEKVSEFTTFHNCCESRVTNIHLIADAVDGAIVMPGETWSLNDHVGERTLEKGYQYAGAIIGGYVQCCDNPINIGGGTSQFTTTLYNAIFFGGYEDVEHSPHSIYFSRYPEGREATLGFPEPDLVFRNNTDAAVLIDTSHTDTSITVKFFGDNGGIEVEAGLSDRYNFSGVRTIYEVNRDLDPCVFGSRATGRVKSAGSGGWSVDIYRYITHPDGEEATEEWTWHYSGGFRVIEYNPQRCRE